MFLYERDGAGISQISISQSTLIPVTASGTYFTASSQPGEVFTKLSSAALQVCLHLCVGCDRRVTCCDGNVIVIAYIV